MIEEDDIMREIRATREAFAVAHNYDVRAMLETLSKLELSSGRKVVPFKAPSTDSLPETHKVDPLSNDVSR